MHELKLTIETVAYDALPSSEGLRLLVHLAEGKAAHLGFPLRAAESAGHVSHSPFLDRSAAAAVIAAQNPTHPAPDPAARYVVAGQQPGLLTGPLYTFLKAVSAISLASGAAREVDVPLLPLFWIAGEDHDVQEVNRVSIAGERFVHEYRGRIARGRVPQVADIALHAARDPLLEFLRRQLPATQFTAGVLDLVASTDFSDYASAFRSLMHHLFADWDLRLVDAAALRPLTAPVLAAMAEGWQEVERALAAGAAHLVSHGFAAPLSGTRIYEIVGGRRVPLELSAGGAVLAAGHATLPELAEEIRCRPADFSPGAALRPICQDGALPVHVTLGGPAELLYFWQIAPLYAAAGVKASLRQMRASATFIEPPIARVRRKAGLSATQLFNPPATAPGETDPRSADIAQRGAALLDALGGLAGDPPPRWLRTGREQIASGLARIEGALREEAAARVGRDRHRMEKIAAAILPGGKPQERAINILHFINRYGPSFVGEVIGRLDPWAGKHQVVTLTPTAQED